MAATVLSSRAPRGAHTSLAPTRDQDVVASYLEDAAHFPGGRADALFAPASEAEVAAVLRQSRVVLPIGAQSSLTGGATPFGGTLLSTARLNRIEEIGSGSVRVQAGVSLAELDEALANAGRYYPPTPTFLGAFVGGVVSTNAAGAATFKYGTTRDWVQRLTIVLPAGDVLDIARGAVHAHPDGYFELLRASGTTRVSIPTYNMPAVQKLSAGYFARPGMDLIDLFIGAEGTLGVVTEATLRVVEERPALCLAFVTFASNDAAWSFVGRLRDAAMVTWRLTDPGGIDVSGIEHLDARCLAILREEGIDRKNRVIVPDAAQMAVLITLELPPATTSAEVYDEIGRAGDGHAPDTALTRFCALLAEYDAVDRTEIAAPGDRARTAQLLNLREAVPAAVNQRIGLAKQRIDARIEKTAADVIVPFEQLRTLVGFCEAEFRRRGLDAALWGHTSDGNIHPNVIPSTFEDVKAGREAMLAIGREAIRLGGAPLAEHGVGRNHTKQQLLLDLYGPRGIEEMRRVKAAIDPEGKLAPGVIFGL